QILKIPYNGQAVFTNEWDLTSLEYSQETEGPYCTDLPTPDDIRRLLELERVDELIRRECVRTRKDIGNRIAIACLAHILDCVVGQKHYRLAYCFVKRIERAEATQTRKSSIWRCLTLIHDTS
ncbi:hypothetical protein Tco_0044267, partial [Tanacetum coccineum]